MTARSFDVIVCGGGNAGLVAALSAKEAGASVALLEAASLEERGGNSRFAGAVFAFPHAGLDHVAPLLCDSAKKDLHRCAMAPHTPAALVNDIMSTSRGKADKTLIDVTVKHGYDTVKWMRDQGVHWQLTLNKFFDESKLGPGLIQLPPGAGLMAKDQGVGLTTDLWTAVEEASISVFYNCPAHDLLSDGNRILGVRARSGDQFTDFCGQVVLASGGFEANPRLRRQYLGEGWDLVVVRGTRFNTGKMLEKAIGIGAQAVGHWGAAHASPQDLHAPRVGDLRVTDKMSRYSYPWGITVNADGKRFFDEGENFFGLTYAKTGTAIGQQSNAMAFQIFDQKALHLLEPRYSTGTPISDDTLEGLARKLGINPRSFVQTVQDFNSATSPGEFDPIRLDGLSTGSHLAIPKSNWAQPIDQPPYVAYEVTVGITFTYGGLKTDTTARVLNNEGQPMSGLWAVGEVAGGYFYHNYPVGSGLMKGAVFGRVAGKEAAERARSRGKLRQEAEQSPKVKL